MDKKLMEIIARNAATRRPDAILNAVGLYWLGDYGIDDLAGRLTGIFREERELLSAKEISDLGEREETVELTPV